MRERETEIARGDEEEEKRSRDKFLLRERKIGRDGKMAREKKRREEERGRRFSPLTRKCICARGDEGEEDRKFIVSPLSRLR